jgi:hypothetical protein
VLSLWLNQETRGTAGRTHQITVPTPVTDKALGLALVVNPGGHIGTTDDGAVGRASCARLRCRPAYVQRTGSHAPMTRPSTDFCYRMSTVYASHASLARARIVTQLSIRLPLAG